MAQSHRTSLRLSQMWAHSIWLLYTDTDYDIDADYVGTTIDNQVWSSHDLEACAHMW